MCVRSARGSPRHESGTGVGKMGRWGKVLGSSGLKDGDLPNWQCQTFNCGSVSYRPVPTTPCSQEMQYLIGTPHSPRWQEVLLGGCKVMWSCLAKNCVPLFSQVLLRHFYTIFSWGEKGDFLWRNHVCFLKRDYVRRGLACFRKPRVSLMCISSV